MRDARLRREVSHHISDALVNREKAEHDAKLYEAWDAHEAQGGTEDDWEYPFAFDQEVAETAGQTLAQDAVSRDPDTFQAACAEIQDIGLDVITLMSEAHIAYNSSLTKHDDKLPELERRRREVMRVYMALQKARPVAGDVIDG